MRLSILSEEHYDYAMAEAEILSGARFEITDAKDILQYRVDSVKRVFFIQLKRAVLDDMKQGKSTNFFSPQGMWDRLLDDKVDFRRFTDDTGFSGYRFGIGMDAFKAIMNKGKNQSTGFHDEDEFSDEDIFVGIRFNHRNAQYIFPSGDDEPRNLPPEISAKLVAMAQEARKEIIEKILVMPDISHL